MSEVAGLTAAVTEPAFVVGCESGISGGRRAVPGTTGTTSGAMTGRMKNRHIRKLLSSCVSSMGRSRHGRDPRNIGVPQQMRPEGKSHDELAARPGTGTQGLDGSPM